jgi:hypothetical protein
VKDQPINIFSPVKDLFGSPERLETPVYTAGVFEVAFLVLFWTPIRCSLGDSTEGLNQETIHMRDVYVTLMAAPIVIHEPNDSAATGNYLFTREGILSVVPIPVY